MGDFAIYLMIGCFFLLIIFYFKLLRNYGDAAELLEIQVKMIDALAKHIKTKDKEIEVQNKIIKTLEAKINE